MAGATAEGTGIATGTAALAGLGAEAGDTEPVPVEGAGGGIIAGIGICGM
jgi:hypothetical protein